MSRVDGIDWQWSRGGMLGLAPRGRKHENAFPRTRWYRSDLVDAEHWVRTNMPNSSTCDLEGHVAHLPNPERPL